MRLRRSDPRLSVILEGGGMFFEQKEIMAIRPKMQWTGIMGNDRNDGKREQ